MASPEEDFIQKVSKATGIDPRVLFTQYSREGSPGNYPGYYNYGNMPDSTAATLGVPYAAGAYGFANYGNADAGAKATAQEYANLGLGDEGGKTVEQQLEDIQNSPWASSHYGYSLPATFASNYGAAALNTKTASGGGGILSGILGGVKTGTDLLANPAGLSGDIGGLSGLGGAANTLTGGLFGGLKSGIVDMFYSAFFFLIGAGLVLIGLALIAWTVMGKVGAPGVVGMAQTQMRISQSAARTAESHRASTVRESQATERLGEQRASRQLRERRLEVHERGVERREPEYRKFSDVKRDDRTVSPNR